jgi:hypothetical protein
VNLVYGKLNIEINIQGGNMNWKKAISVAILTGAALAAMLGCSQSGTTGTAAVQAPAATQATNVPAAQTPSANQPKAVPDRQMPPSGVSMNGTIPAFPTMNLAAAAVQLGITQSQLNDALGNTQQGLPDLAEAAAKLGITEDALRQALGFSNNGMMPGSNNGTMPGGPPPSGTDPAVQSK